MSLVSKKICLIGDFSVGKTSLTQRFVSNTFSDQYLTTVGVRIETRTVTLSPEQEIKLVVWDIAGADELSTISKTYMQGASGYLLVADGTRKQTLNSAHQLHKSIQKQWPDLPYIGLLNKADLGTQWEIGEEEIARWPEVANWQKTSALTGEGVEDAFLQLARKMAPAS